MFVTPKFKANDDAPAFWFRESPFPWFWFRVSIAALQFAALISVASYYGATKGQTNGQFSIYKARIVVNQTAMYTNDNIDLRAVDTSRRTVLSHYATPDLRVVVMLFFLFSFMGQVSVLYYLDGLGDLSASISSRYVEYAVSASTMYVAIGIACGISDLYTLWHLALAMFSTNVIGLAVHLLMRANAQRAWVVPLHLASWLVCAGSYATVLWSFVDAIDPLDFGAKDFVKGIVFSQMVLFCCFGLVQIYDVVQVLGTLKDPNDANHLWWVATLYDVFSVVAKLLLGALIMVPVGRNQWGK